MQYVQQEILGAKRMSFGAMGRGCAQRSETIPRSQRPYKPGAAESREEFVVLGAKMTSVRCRFFRGIRGEEKLSK